MVGDPLNKFDHLAEIIGARKTEIDLKYTRLTDTLNNQKKLLENKLSLYMG